MKFGIFDHMDLGGFENLSAFYEDRLKLAELYDETGIHAYHLAEHHATPLGMAPSPIVFTRLDWEVRHSCLLDLERFSLIMIMTRI